MSYLIIGLIILRVCICDRVMPINGILFDLIFSSLFFIYLLTKKHLKFNRSLVILLFGFLGALCVSLPFSVNVYTSQNEFLKFLVCGFMFLFVFMQSRSRKRLILSWILFCSFLLSLRAIYQYFSGIAYINGNYTTQQITSKGFYALEMLKQKRVVSFFFAPNILAGYLVMIIPISAGYAMRNNYRKNLKKMILFMILLIINFWALLLTQSFGAFLSLGLAILISGIIGLKIKHQLFTFKKLISAALMILLCLLMVFSKRSDAFTDFKNPDNSITQRIYYWQAAEKIFLENPLWGAGLGNFSILYTKFKHPDANETIYAHNIVLQFLAESGPLSLILFMIFISAVYMRFSRKEKDPVEISLLVSSVAFLIYNMIDYNFFVIQCGYLWWVITACLVYPHHNLNTHNKKRSGFPVYVARLIVITVSFLAVFYLQAEYRSQSDLNKAFELLNSKKIDRSIRKAEDALALRKNNDVIYCFLATAYQQKAKESFSQLAVKCYKEAIALNKQYCYYYFYLGKYYFAHDQLKDSVVYFKNALDLYPTNKQFNYYFFQSKDLYQRMQALPKPGI